MTTPITIALGNPADPQPNPPVDLSPSPVAIGVVPTAGTIDTGLVYPPNVPLAYSATPVVAKPNYLETITDPTYGTEVVCVSNVADRGQAYSSLACWNADGTLLALAAKSSSIARMIDGTTYADLYAIGADLRFSANDPAMCFRRSGLNILRYAADMDGIAVAQTYAVGSMLSATEISFGGDQGTCSDDGKYIPIQFKRANNDVGLAILNTQTGLIHSSIVLGNSALGLTTILNAFGVSHSGGFAYLENGPQGADIFSGGWVYDIDLNTSTRRQVTQYTRHFDWGYDGFGNEAVATVSQIAGGGDGINTHAGIYRADNGSWTELVANWPNGHISARASLLPGEWFFSQFTAPPSASVPGGGTIFSINAGDPSTVRFFCHTHHNTNSGYYGEPQAAPSPDGTKVAFRTPWTPESVGTNLCYVAGMDVSQP
jgi:hypothetical protein